MSSLPHSLQSVPFIAILRGISSHEVVSAGEILYTAGFRAIEIPLNSPTPFDSIAKLVRSMPSDCLVGAGTVITVQQLDDVIATGAKLCVMPNVSPAIIQRAKQAQMQIAPGVATISEAFLALESGATALKLFPSESIPPSVLKAWKSVLPEVICIPTGGITPESLENYWRAGARGFGLGSQLYHAGMELDLLKQRANEFVQAAGRLNR